MASYREMPRLPKGKISSLLIGFFLPLLFLVFGCKEANLVPEEDEDQRFIYVVAPIGKITDSLIDNSSNAELAFNIARALEGRIQLKNGPDCEKVWGWNPSEQAIYLIFSMDITLREMGLKWLYHGPMKAFTQHLPAALRKIGATKCASLMQESNEVNGGLSGKYGSPRSLVELENAYFEITEKEHLDSLMTTYILSNQKDFVEE